MTTCSHRSSEVAPHWDYPDPTAPSKDSVSWAEERYRLATVAGKVAVWRMDLLTGRFETDGSLERIIGYEVGELGTEPDRWRAVTHPDDLESTGRLWRQVSEGLAERYDAEYRLRHKDGSIRWVEVRGAGLKDATGRVVAISGTTRDITERRSAEEQWQESERRFMALFQSSPVPTTLTRLEDGLIQDANRAFLEMVGYGRTEVVGHSERELGLWAEPEECEALVRRLQAGTCVHGVETGFRKRTGEVGTVLISAVIVDWGGQPHLLATAVDHTERHRVEAAFHASEAVRRQALESSPDVVFAIDREYRLLFNNQLHQRVLATSGGYPLAPGENVLLPTYTPEVRAHWLDAYDRALRGEGVRFEVEWPNLDGHVQVFESNLSPLRDASGTIIGVLVVARDVTERKRLEAERAGALARLAVVEEQERHRLSRELHDQMAQRLVALAVDLKLLETTLAAGRPEAGRVRSMRRAVDDLQKRVRQMAWDLRAGEGLAGDLAITIRDYVDDWSERANVPVDFESRGLDGKQLPALLETTLYRVTQEALVNVEKHARARRTGVLLQLERGMVRLTVEDDGRGFDVDAVWASLERTHRLGLLGMRERVALAGGTFLVESSPGGGTTILVRIPLAAGTETS